MVICNTILKPIEWIGRQGTRAIAALVVVGIALPSIGSALKPFVTEAVFVLLCIAFLRIEFSAIKAHFRRPKAIIAATVWASVAIPFLFGLGCRGLGLPEGAPDLFLGLMLQAVASPMMAAPALAALMGLDATLVLVTLITSTALIPFTAPLFAHLFVGSILSVSPAMLAMKLFAIIAGAALIGFSLRRLFGMKTIEQRRDLLDGINVVVLFVFVAAIMESVGPRILTAPIISVAFASIAFIVFFVILFLTILLFRFFGWKKSLALGFMVSQRNMGLMLAATGGVLPELTWFYFALSQFPIYLSPYLLQPLTQRILSAETANERKPVNKQDSKKTILF